MYPCIHIWIYRNTSGTLYVTQIIETDVDSGKWNGFKRGATAAPIEIS